MATDNNNKVLNVPNKGKVPRLRFPEFTEEWNFKALDTLAPNISAGKDYAKEGNYKLYGSTGVICTTDKPSYKGEILLVARVGANAGYLQYVNGEFGVTDNTLVVNAHDNNRYIYYYLQHYNLNRLVFGSGQPLITGGMLKKVPIGICYDCAEKNKIVKLLSLLDARIATQNKIIEDLKKLKVAICNKLIDNLVNREPLIRFTEVYSKAGEGGTPETSKSEYYENGNIPFIKIDDLSNKYIISNKDFITDLGLQKSSAWIIPTHSLIYSNGATIGAISINTYEVCTKQGILGIVPKTSISVEYLYCLMLSNYFSKRVHRIITHGTMATAYLKDINKIKVPIPCMQKQLEIANTFSSATNKIETELNILSLLLKQKQYLLQQMFI